MSILRSFFPVALSRWPVQYQHLLAAWAFCSGRGIQSLQLKNGLLVSLTSTLPSTNVPCSWDGKVCFAASLTNHMVVLQLRRRIQGCPWDRSTCSGAARRGGHSEVLQWARSHDCLWDKTTCDLTRINEWPRGRVKVSGPGAKTVQRDSVCVCIVWWCTRWLRS